MARKDDKKFVQYKRVGPSWPDHAVGGVDDMPLKHWDKIQRVPKDRKRFEFIRIIDLAENGAMTKKTDVPIVEDPYECPLCGLVAESEGKLAIHRAQVHG